ncbi:Uncharacterized protein ALO57_03865 [Pseudomonas coronafaciens pv. oryzae]|uniref:hypothetical protein n=1 Tax=Pseudomonas coronafaciens TaxID=53409 RepID=UPI0006B54399|nr:hypothetical protein [Pseudomonas coronafaciens]KPB55311.1 Uncharacterized protein AC511_4022 [Pseudomonas coronafaciens pv. oryzae]KPY07302.1 Uncharacterized protein ALO57_03865 [Pseudomonas coronafaciens pv. oryzae]
MTSKKTITMLYRQINFKSGGHGPAKLMKSVAHSLRILPTKENKIKWTKKQEWDENLTHKNLIYCPSLGHKLVKLDALTEEEKVKIQKSLVEKIKLEQAVKDQKTDNLETLSKYKAKINKWFSSITDQDDPLKFYLSKILAETKHFDVEKEIDELSQFEFARKNQKTETVKKYFEFHNNVVENKSEISRNHVFIQEAFFKFPKRKDAGGDDLNISSSDFLLNIQSFYNNNFPDYPIKLIIFHGDEKGDHPHIFVDAKNKRTGKYDLLVAQKKLVNDNIEKIKEEYPNAKPLDFLRDESDYFNKKLQAQYFQTLFYQHSNKMLEKYNVEAKKLEKTEENNARMRLIEEDAKKPKIEREFSFYNAETLRFTEEYELAKNNASKALEEEKTINERLTKANQALEFARKEFTDAQEETRVLNEDLPKLRSEKQTLTKTNNGLKVENETLQSKNDELSPLAQDYDLISSAYNELTPKYEKLLENYKEVISNAQRQIKDGIREFCTVMWGLKDWGKNKFSYNPFKKYNLGGAPEDIQEFDERTEKLVRLANDETVETFLELDFLIPKKLIPQAFREKVKDEYKKPDRNERNIFISKNVDLKSEPEKAVTQSKATTAYAPKSEKFFDDNDREKKIEEAIARAKGKPKV